MNTSTQLKQNIYNTVPRFSHVLSNMINLPRVSDQLIDYLLHKYAHTLHIHRDSCITDYVVEALDKIPWTTVDNTYTTLNSKKLSDVLTSTTSYRDKKLNDLIVENNGSLLIQHSATYNYIDEANDLELVIVSTGIGHMYSTNKESVLMVHDFNDAVGDNGDSIVLLTSINVLIGSNNKINFDTLPEYITELLAIPNYRRFYEVRPKYNISYSQSSQMDAFGIYYLPTKNVTIVPPIKEMYHSNVEDSWAEISNLLTKVKNNESGVFFLTGEAGTGKTSLFFELSKHRPVIFSNPEHIVRLTKEADIHLIQKLSNSVVVLDDAINYLEGVGDYDIDAFTSAIIQLTDGIIGKTMNIMFVIVGNKPMRNLNSALGRRGRYQGKLHLDLLPAMQANDLLSILNESDANIQLGDKIFTKPVSLADILLPDAAKYERPDNSIGFVNS